MYVSEPLHTRYRRRHHIFLVFSIMTSHDECLRVLRLRVTPGSPFTSCMGIKAHQRIAASTETKQSDTLFCVGIPLSFDEFAMKSVFTCFGDVHNVVMHANKASAFFPPRSTLHRYRYLQCMIGNVGFSRIP